MIILRHPVLKWFPKLFGVDTVKKKIFFKLQSLNVKVTHTPPKNCTRTVVCYILPNLDKLDHFCKCTVIKKKPLYYIERLVLNKAASEV